MAKELPYFEFEPAEYLAGDISFCSLESQGLFVLICCYYWQRSCSLTKEQFLKRMNKPKEFEELIKEKIIKVDDRGFISINFLNDKFEKATEKSKINSINGAKGGRPKKQNKSENKPNAFNSLSETKGIREDNIIKEEIKENNITDEKIYFNQEIFINWFNDCRKHIGLESNIKKLSRTEQLYFSELNKVYTIEEFKKAFKGFSNDAFFKQNNMLFPTHFLKVENFTKFLNYKEKTTGEKLLG